MLDMVAPLIWQVQMLERTMTSLTVMLSPAMSAGHGYGAAGIERFGCSLRLLHGQRKVRELSYWVELGLS